MTYFTSDQHFGHFNIIRLSHRPFSSLDEMNETMIAKWNAKVQEEDMVYILGDLFFRAAAVEPILQRLKGRKHLVLGNHDHTWTTKVRLADYFQSVQTICEIDIGGKSATLCHYPMLSYPQARLQRESGESTIAVTAYGYRGVERVDYEEVYGGDGKWHKVAVHWTEYLPVQRTSNMCLSERGTPSDLFKRRAAASRESAFRRSILSFLSGA